MEYASEFRYRNAPIDKHTLVLAITQSGETADTLAGLRESRRRGHKVLALCNVVGSTIAREADARDGLAGPDAQRVQQLEAENRALAQELRETRRANEILRKAAAYFAQAELDRPQK